MFNSPSFTRRCWNRVVIAAHASSSGTQPRPRSKVTLYSSWAADMTGNTLSRIAMCKMRQDAWKHLAWSRSCRPLGSAAPLAAIAAPESPDRAWPTPTELGLLTLMSMPLITAVIPLRACTRLSHLVEDNEVAICPKASVLCVNTSSNGTSKFIPSPLGEAMPSKPAPASLPPGALAWVALLVRNGFWSSVAGASKLSLRPASGGGDGDCRNNAADEAASLALPCAPRIQPSVSDTEPLILTALPGGPGNSPDGVKALGVPSGCNGVGGADAVCF
mmetsp:Transcript_57852/g.106432  ORF Transcript_57852/g.106432 Transcript_57852/m.106432 type:complete len:275 (-) Transcript_57852:116-940(-)